MRLTISSAISIWRTPVTFFRHQIALGAMALSLNSPNPVVTPYSLGAALPLDHALR